ncbi:hypothetical protein ACIP1X_05200 [Pseudomonas sp. NPDC088885]|uniref:hypothetical protein n=1 Tax=Pseudomonas sp. NPDC088885 TaxID=3364457 RepID=UPI00381211A3
MSTYLYLKEHAFVNSWVAGGKIPISPASTYKKLERSGIFTPDENLIHTSTVDLRAPNLPYRIGLGSRGGSITGVTVNGVPFPDNPKIDFYEEDGLILSFSSRLTRSVARKLDKKACVKILDILELKRVIDHQLGVASISGCCKYTSGHQRNHFLKSDEDEWQAEYRLFWPIAESREIILPPNMAEPVILW